MLPEWLLTKHREYVHEKRGRKMRVDDTLKICPVCRRSWEYINQNQYYMDVKYYPAGNIPSIGKEKIICKDCQ